MISPADGLLILSLLGVAVFAINGALTAIQAARLDVVGVVMLGSMTALGGGIIRDVMLNTAPPEGLADWRFPAVAMVASAAVTLVHRPLARYTKSVVIFDAAGLSLFCVTGTLTALNHGAGPLLAVLLGVTTAIGGGTIRDLMVGQIPTVLTSDLYAVPAAVGAVVAMLFWTYGGQAPLGYLLAAAVAFAIRMVGVQFNLNAPQVGHN